MQVRIVLDFDVNLETDGEELDMDVIRSQVAECIIGHVERVMDNEKDLDSLVDDITDVIDFSVSELTFSVLRRYNIYV